MKASSQAPELIQTQAALDRFCVEARAFKLIGVDTEFENQKTYWPRLALIQVVIQSRIVLIDAVSWLDLTPFLALLADPERILVVYSGQADIELLYHAGMPAWGPVFDVQMGARFLGIDYKGGLGGLVGLLLGIKMKKSEAMQRSMWCERPLSAAQLRYAADDVRYLLPVYERLLEILKECGRAAWAWEEMGTLEDPTQHARGPQTRFRVRGPKRRAPLAKAILHAICVWRDALARAEDRPARFILDDQEVNRLTDQAERGDAPLMSGLGEAADLKLRALVEEAVRGHLRPPKSGSRRDSDERVIELEVLKASLYEKAEALGVDPTLLATMHMLKSFSKHPHESPFLGWRAVIFADWHARWG